LEPKPFSTYERGCGYVSQVLARRVAEAQLHEVCRKEAVAARNVAEALQMNRKVVSLFCVWLAME
jgi:hypothetical protein